MTPAEQSCSSQRRRRTPNKKLVLPVGLRPSAAQFCVGPAVAAARRRKVQSVNKENVTEKMIEDAVKAKGWKVAQTGDDYVFAPGSYTIRPIV